MNNNQVANLIDQWFMAGRLHILEDGATTNDCPYQTDTLAALWWCRGWIYEARLLRIYKAEQLIEEMEQQ